MLTKEVAPIPTDPNVTYDCVGIISSNCFPTPKIRFTAGLNYDSNEWWAVGGRVRYMDSVEYIGTADRIAKANLDSAQVYLDLNARFNFLANSDLVIGISNVLDKEPPLVGGTLASNANTIAGFYDTLGRYVFANVTVRF
jgi:outer membrane receptor protein involved in Fe transport